MSGRPNDVDVAEIKRQISRVAISGLRIQKLREGIAKSKGELEAQESEYRLAQQEVLDLLAKMDVRSSGNIGYEGRVIAFLTMLVGAQ